MHVGPYRLIAALGAGGMGKVYLGQSRAGRQVAIKVIRAELAEDAGFRLRFAREVSAARLVSPLYTAAVVDADPEAELPWLATTYIEGPSLEDHVRESGPMSPAAVLTLAVGLAEALASIHAVGLVHRDLKPSNVLIHDTGPHIIDFGIALADGDPRMTTSLVVGTPSYMAPERIHGSEAGPAGDVYSLGATLVFAATGHSLVPDGPMFAQIMQVTVGRFDLSDVPAPLRPLVVRCTSRRPAERPTAEELTSILSASGVAAPAPGWHTTTAEAPQVTLPTLGWRMSRRTALILAGAAVTAGAGGFAAWRLLDRSPQQSPQLSTQLSPQPSTQLSPHMLWRVRVGDPSAGDAQSGLAGVHRVVVIGGRIIAATANGVIAVDPNGARVWIRPLSTLQLSLCRWTDAVVAFDANQIWLLSPSDGTTLATFDAVGSEQRTAAADNPDGLPVRIRGLAVSPDTAFVNLGTAMLALRRDLSPRWRTPRPAAVGGPRPAIGVPIVASAGAIIAVETGESTVDVYQYDAQSGAKGWSTQYPRTPAPGAGPGGAPPGGPQPERGGRGGPPAHRDTWDRSEGRIAGGLVVLRSAHQIFVLTASRGQQRWHRDSEKPVAGLAVVGEAALVGADALRAHELVTGDFLWDLGLRGVVAAPTEEGTIFAASEGAVTLMRPDSGRVWNDPLPGSLAQAWPDPVTIEKGVGYVVFHHPSDPDAQEPEFEVAAFRL